MDAGTVTDEQNPEGRAGSLLTSIAGPRKKELVKHILQFLIPLMLVGCAGTHPRGQSRIDQFESVKIDQMVGNNVSSAPLQKVIVCLNARRESRPITALTNVTVIAVTNSTVSTVTNETITIATNYLATTMTNLAPALSAAPGPVSGEAAAAAAATVSDAPGLTATNTPVLLGTNTTASLAQNNSALASPSQRGANNQIVRTLNNQITSTSNNLQVTLMTNLVVTMETNSVVLFVTNHVVSSITNQVILPTNGLANDYFVYTELIPPPDFTLVSSGESLVLLVDGVRHGLTSTPPGASFQSRRGFTSTFYRAAPELLVAIANAQDVRLRLRGTSGVIERTLSGRSRENFKTFLVRYFTPDAPEATPPTPAPAAAATPPPSGAQPAAAPALISAAAVRP